MTCLAWPSEGPIIVGLADGKVRAATVKANKTQNLYGADSMTLALAVKFVSLIIIKFEFIKLIDMFCFVVKDNEIN